MRGVRSAVFGTSSASACHNHSNSLPMYVAPARRWSPVVLCCAFAAFFDVPVAKLIRGIETVNMFSFPVLKMFCPFPWSRWFYNFRKEFERYRTCYGREPRLVESSAKWPRSVPLSWDRWSTVTGCKSFFVISFFFFMLITVSVRIKLIMQWLFLLWLFLPGLVFVH